jgi:hypothetical protein
MALKWSDVESGVSERFTLEKAPGNFNPKMIQLITLTAVVGYLVLLRDLRSVRHGRPERRD